MLREIFYRLLLVATYGLFNADAKWKMDSDMIFLEIGLTPAIYIPQSFYLSEGGNLVLIGANVDDDILVDGSQDLR